MSDAAKTTVPTIYAEPCECAPGACAALAALAAVGMAVVPVEPTPVWVHQKRGTAYREIGRATLQAATGPAAEGDTLVIYRGDDGRLWAREVHEFQDGRFALAADTPSARPES